MAPIVYPGVIQTGDEASKKAPSVSIPINGLDTTHKIDPVARR